MMARYKDHYIDSVTTLGEIREIITTQPIFSRSGIRLVEQGVQIDSSFLELLSQHKLLMPIDQCVRVSDTVTCSSLRAHAQEILAAEPQFQLMCSSLPSVENLLQSFDSMPLLAPLAFRLTVARDCRSEIFEHSIRATLISLFLAIKSRLPESKLGIIAAAAMFHDIGMLHIDPELLRPGRRIEDKDELCHIHAHPVTAYLILRKYPPYHPEVSLAVLKHHERLDGSGYPRGLTGQEIGPISRILMLAEAITVLFEKSWRYYGASRLSVMLKMNRRKFSPELISHLYGLLRGGEPRGLDAVGEISGQAISARLARVAEIFRGWRRLYKAYARSTPEAAGSSLVNFVNERMLDLESILIEIGFDPDELSRLAADAQCDLVALAELQLMERESRWQIDDILKELRRRKSDFATDIGAQKLVETWMKRIDLLLKES